MLTVALERLPSTTYNRMKIGAFARVLNRIVLTEVGLMWFEAGGTALPNLVAVVRGNLNAADSHWRLGRALEVL